MAFYTQIHDFKEYSINKTKQLAIIQAPPYTDSVDYKKNIISLVGKALWKKSCDWIVISQETSNAMLDSSIAKLMSEHERDLIIITGAYTHQDEKRSTILVKKGKNIKCFFQKKLLEKHDDTDMYRHLFINTGMGNFSVLIAGDSINEADIKDLSGLVDALVVVANNTRDRAFSKCFEKYCHESYMTICYANQTMLNNPEEIPENQADNSAFFIPYQDENKRRIEITIEENGAMILCPLNLESFEEGKRGKEPGYPNQDDPKLAKPLLDIITRDENNPLSEQDWIKLVTKEEIETTTQEEEKEEETLLLEHWEVKRRGKKSWQFSKLKDRYKLTELPLFIGRGSKNTLQIKNPKVSGVHLQINFKNNQYYIKDLKSTGGTFLLKEKKLKLLPQQPIELKPDETFWLCNLYKCQLQKDNNDNIILSLCDKDGKQHEEHKLEKFPFVVGRHGNFLQLDKNIFRGISGAHVEINYKDDKFYLKDLESKHGTFLQPVNPCVKVDSPIKGKFILEDELLFCLVKDEFYRLYLNKSTIKTYKQANHEKVIFISEE